MGNFENYGIAFGWVFWTSAIIGTLLTAYLFALLHGINTSLKILVEQGKSKVEKKQPVSAYEKPVYKGESWNCPDCGTSNPRVLMVCKGCGRQK